LEIGPKYSKIVLVFSLVIVVVLIGGLSLGVLKQKPSNSNTTINPPVILRIDDIQDFAFKEGQSYLLNYHARNDIPVDLAVIPGYIGEDLETVNLLKQCIREGSEISTHGWQHENLGLLDESTQTTLLLRSSITFKRVFGIESRILVPPMFDYNNSTLEAMRKTGYNILSSSVDQQGLPSTSKSIQLIPATVELSIFKNSTWTMKSQDTILSEVKVSVSKYGYAVVVLHPQEFLKNNTLNKDSANNYEALIKPLSQKYHLTDFEEEFTIP
jgi:peptidoglycan/xylan/chitin deacetylase (PgdA/CDA1 family)